MPDDLLQDHVKVVFREFLGRDASPAELGVWMATGSLRTLMDGVLASGEYADRVATRGAVADSARTGPFLNCWIEDFEPFSRPPGDLSADGVAVVGTHGHLFLQGGSNHNLAAYRGQVPMASDWLVRWRELMDFRAADARRCGATLVQLVVPDKLAVYGDCFAGDLEGAAPRPVMRLVSEAGLPLVYPCDELRSARAGGDTYARTDSHLTWRGNEELARLTLTALGVAHDPLDEIAPVETPRLMGGDLGAHFAPPVVEVCTQFAPASRAELVFDNWPVVSFVGGHIATRRVFRQADAPDQRVAVLYGDSYGFTGVGFAGLSWFLAQLFREVHFVWVPFGWDADYVEKVGAEVVVSQTAERFMVRVPRDRVDVTALERDIASGALGLERIFADPDPV